MKSRKLATLGLSALILVGASVGTAITTNGIAFAGALTARDMKQAASDAAKAQRALANGKIAQAIGYAERAVRFSPQDASYRALLGNAYLKAGRFASARDAFTDSVSLSPADAATALTLALTQTATGDWASARKTLDDYADMIPVADRGLALALAGDPATAVEMLTDAARGPESSAKTRQNLALALALAGRWPEAKSVAALDVAANEVDKRMLEWASFARPRAASDQVASLLGVRAVQDQGQPVALALNAAVPTQAQTADSIDAYMPGKPGEARPAQTVADATPVSQPVEEQAPVPVMASADSPTPTLSIGTMPSPRQAIVFAARSPVVQALPASYVPARRAGAPSVGRQMVAATGKAPSVPQAAVVKAAVTKGGYYVQLGAFPSVAVARDGWVRATRRLPDLAGKTPSGMNVSTAAGSFYRLSVGGFARSDAVAICSSYRAKGGDCFVRASSGDQVARWVQPNRQLASR